MKESRPGVVFNTAAYNNQDGTGPWTSNWYDPDGSTSTGNVRVSAAGIELYSVLFGTTQTYRDANLAGVSSAQGHQLASSVTRCR